MALPIIRPDSGRDHALIRGVWGSMRTPSAPDPAAFERANYMKIFQIWRPFPEHGMPPEGYGEL